MRRSVTVSVVQVGDVGMPVVGHLVLVAMGVRGEARLVVHVVAVVMAVFVLVGDRVVVMDVVVAAAQDEQHTRHGDRDRGDSAGLDRLVEGHP
jgi:hypothetical protein